MKVKIQLTPYNALSIFSFLREFINNENSDEPEFKAIHEAVNQYENEIVKNITEDHIDDFNAENKVNQLIGKSPQAKNR